MQLSDILLLIALVLLLFLAVRKMIRMRKKGKGCLSGCVGCAWSSTCSHSSDPGK